MILTSYLLKVLLALMLAGLGGAFIRNVRGLCPENSAFELSRDRLLGLALYAASIFLMIVAGGRLAASWGAPETHPLAFVVTALPLALLWAGAVALGLRRSVTLRSVKKLVLASVATLTLFLVASNGRFSTADAFLLTGLMVWLLVVLRPGKTPAAN
jgi:hypothetical protein